MPRSKMYRGSRGGGHGGTSTKKQKPVHEAKGNLQLTVTTDKGSLYKVLQSALLVSTVSDRHSNLGPTDLLVR